jgi:prevent-host-death family protein
MVNNHGMFCVVDEIAVSRFKATCLAVLQRVSRTGRPVLVTRFGKPVAEVVPPRRPAVEAGWLGCMKDRAEIKGDVVRPALEAGAWRASRE